VMLPLIFQIARHFNRNEPPPKRVALEDKLVRFEQSVGQARRSLADVAGQTHPIRDDDEKRDGKHRDDERR
jgi:hypothetical protein